jgi:RNA 2',3'-cyclic 3'-phosphodiesterase
MSMLRVFIAIELPGGLQKAISQVIERLQATAGRSAVRWAPATNIHLTLKFLGEIAPTGLGVIEEALKNEAGLHPGFRMEAAGLGAFPNTKRPRVIWLGVEAPPELTAVQRGIDAAIARLGYASETRAFSPHLTLGRVRENASPSELAVLAAKLNEVKFDSPGPFDVVTVHLFKSDLLPGGSVYTRLFSAALLNLTDKESP